jgi:rhomboid protease GluP
VSFDSGPEDPRGFTGPETSLDPVEGGFVPPDPTEPPPVELWSAVGDVPPFATVLLLLAWGVAFALMAYRGDLGESGALIAWGANVSTARGLDSAWRLVASTFLHAGAAHIFFNATSMLIFGPAVERVFTRWGFLVVYAAGGVLASEASLLWRDWRTPGVASLSVGASGAIFALGGALLAGAFRLRHRLAPSRARALGAATLFLLAQGLVSGATRHGTDNAAHAAGLASGLVLGLVAPLSTRLGGRGPGALGSALGALAALALGVSFAWAVRGGLGLG